MTLPDSRAVYVQVKSDAVRNLIFEIGVAGFALLVATFWLLGAKILWWLLVVITVLDGLQTAGLVATGLVMPILARKAGETLVGEGRLWAGTALRILSVVAAVLIILWLRPRLW